MSLAEIKMKKNVSPIQQARASKTRMSAIPSPELAHQRPHLGMIPALGKRGFTIARSTPCRLGSRLVRVTDTCALYALEIQPKEKPDAIEFVGRLHEIDAVFVA